MKPDFYIWGNEHCKKCKEVKSALSAKNIPYKAMEFTTEAMYALWNNGEKARATDLYGMAQFQDNNLPIIEKNNISITWEEFDQFIANYSV